MHSRGRSSYTLAIAVVVAIKACTWITGYWLSRDVSRFQAEDFARQFHHYRIIDSEDLRKPRPFLSLWNYADSEWYLSIAVHGYPDRTEVARSLQSPRPPVRYTEHDSVLKYAFFPLYPLTIHPASLVLGVEAAAFAVTLLYGLAAAAAFAGLLLQIFPENRSIQSPALLLLFLYPFSVFYNLYHTESLFLLLSLLCFLTLRLRRYFLMMLCGFLLCLTRPNGIFIVIPLLYAVLVNAEARKPKALLCTVAIPLGLIPYAWLNHRLMGDWLFFSTVQQSWGNPASVLQNLWANLIQRGLDLFSMGFHRFHSSQLDYLVMLLFGAAILAMWLDRNYPRELTIWSTLIWIVPLLSKDLMSFSRYMCVSFPVFIFLALKLKPWATRALLLVFAGGYWWVLARIIHYEWAG